MRALGASQPDSGYPPRRAGDVTISFRKHLIKGICLRYSEEYHEIFYYVYVVGTSCTRVYRVPAGSKNYISSNVTLWTSSDGFSLSPSLLKHILERWWKRPTLETRYRLKVEDSASAPQQQSAAAAHDPQPIHGTVASQLMWEHRFWNESLLIQQWQLVNNSIKLEVTIVSLVCKLFLLVSFLLFNKIGSASGASGARRGQRRDK